MNEIKERRKKIEAAIDALDKAIKEIKQAVAEINKPEVEPESICKTCGVREGCPTDQEQPILKCAWYNNDEFIEPEIDRSRHLDGKKEV